MPSLGKEYSIAANICMAISNKINHMKGKEYGHRKGRKK
jgi:hypothetical protein